MAGKPKLYVNANLKVTASLRMRKAIVNIVNGCVEITFLEPIAHNKSRGDAWKERAAWGLKYYPSYRSILPRAESMVYANLGEKTVLFKNCYTSTDKTDWHGRVDYSKMIDSSGKAVRLNGEVLENVYAAILITKEEFLRINPHVDLAQFSMSVCY